MQIFFTILLSLFFIPSTFNSQLIYDNVKGPITNEISEGLESTVASPFQKIGFGETKANNVNIKAVRDFLKFFKTVTNNKWFLAEDGSSSSTFNRDGVKTIVQYDSRGCRRYIMRVYEENKLPFNIRDMVKREYYDASITLVTEVETYKETVTYVHLQDKETWKKVRVANGEMKLVENFKKG